jgi:L-rhamnose mutarotase
MGSDKNPAILFAAATAFCVGACSGLLLTQLKIPKEQRLTWTYPPKNHDVIDSVSKPFPAPRRYGSVIRLREGHYERYRFLHDDVWQPVLDIMTQANIRNFVIYYHKESGILFQHFEWIGHWKTECNNPHQEDELFQRDMTLIANDPMTKEWWKECEPCQEPFAHWPPGARMPSEGNTTDSWWAACECVTHCGHWPMAYTKEQRDTDFVKMLSL